MSSSKSDTVKIRHLDEDATVELQQLPPAALKGFDPHSTETSKDDPAKARRTLDDMRTLSTDIKEQRQEK